MIQAMPQPKFVLSKKNIPTQAMLPMVQNIFMKNFFLPAKSATPDNKGSKGVMMRKEKESAYEYNAEFGISDQNKKDTISLPFSPLAMAW